ncbi:MAG: FGGY-family carbohydrate kinase [Eubacterium sp.]|nr:FGGY-family carbohydrate kinase [Eubacterium sp.]
MNTKKLIDEGRTAIGIEFGSTRIKAVMVDEAGKPIAEGGFTWENQYVDGIWTYSLDMIWSGLKAAYSELLSDVKTKYDTVIKTTGAIGFSAMMHGYMAFDREDNLLVPFRTWRNTITGEAAEALTAELGFNIPQRWSIAHLHQAILNKEEHVKDIAFFTTLAGYIHWKLSGEKVLGIGDASGMFPIDSKTRDYNEEYIDKYDKLTAPYGYDWKLRDILPKVLSAGDIAGKLTAEGAALLDESGSLKAGIPMCPPEGDAGTGMVATNSVAVRTGNVSAGTSIFAMVVMEKALSKVHPEIDVVTTPVGDDVAMVHCNNCTSDINAWARIFREYSEAMGIEVDTNKLYTTMFKAALGGAADCGGLMGFNYFSGEPVTGFEEGRPLFTRKVNADFSFANFMRLHLYSAVSTLKVGLDILLRDEGVKVDKLFGHGGFFKTPEVGQRIMSAAAGGPITVMETAGEGGAWGMAVLALYMNCLNDAKYMNDHGVVESVDDHVETIAASDKMSLAEFLDNNIFAGESGSTITATAEEIAGFDSFMESFKKALPIEQAAVNAL